MRILCGEPAWARAAGHLGHEGFVLDASHVFDSFYAAKPHFVVLPAGEVPVAVRRAMARYPGARLIQTGGLPPAADCPPDFSAGEWRSHFACDVAVVGAYDPSVDESLASLDNSGLRLKVFGHGPWPVARFCGSAPPSEIADVYASAGFVADLKGDAGQVLAVWAAGGVPVSVKGWEGTGVPGLDECPVHSNLGCWAAETGGGRRVVLREDVLAHHTVAARLKTLLEGLPC